MNEEKKPLSAIKRTALNLIDRFSENLKQQVINDCSDDEVMDVSSKYHPDLRGTYKESEFLNYDEALKFMPFGYNRNRLNDLAKKYGVKNHTYKNAHIGFRKSDIEMLADKVRTEK